MLIKFLNEIFTEIDIQNKEKIDYQSFTNYIIQKASIISNRVVYNKADAIKPYSLATTNGVIPLKSTIKSKADKKESLSGQPISDSMVDRRSGRDS